MGEAIAVLNVPIQPNTVLSTLPSSPFSRLPQSTPLLGRTEELGELVALLKNDFTRSSQLSGPVASARHGWQWLSQKNRCQRALRSPPICGKCQRYRASYRRRHQFSIYRQ